MPDTLNRRAFLGRLAVLSAAGATLALSSCAPKAAPASAGQGEVLPTATNAPTAPVSTPIPPPATAVPPSPAPSAVPTTTPTAGATAVAPATMAASPLPQRSPTPAALATAPAPTVAPAATGGNAYLAVARGASPAELTKRAIAAVGGIEAFVKQGDDVIVKPNICNAYHGPEYASTTNPEVIATIVTLCLGAGAKRVRVMDFPFGGTAQAAYVKSGVAKAVEAAGGQMEIMNRLRYRDVEIPKGRSLKKTRVYGEILDANVVINVPIAKHHSAATLTLGLKNLMGLVEDRNSMHAKGLGQSIADLGSVVRPQLTVVDAVRILMANGPTGGNLNDVKAANTVIASADVVAADAYAATLFNLEPRQISYIRIADELGLGKMDLKSLKIAEISV